MEQAYPSDYTLMVKDPRGHGATPSRHSWEDMGVLAGSSLFRSDVIPLCHPGRPHPMALRLEKAVWHCPGPCALYGWTTELAFQALGAGLLGFVGVCLKLELAAGLSVGREPSC